MPQITTATTTENMFAHQSEANSGAEGRKHARIDTCN